MYIVFCESCAGQGGSYVLLEVCLLFAVGGLRVMVVVCSVRECILFAVRVMVVHMCSLRECLLCDVCGVMSVAVDVCYLGDAYYLLRGMLAVRRVS